MRGSEAARAACRTMTSPHQWHTRSSASSVRGEWTSCRYPCLSGLPCRQRCRSPPLVRLLPCRGAAAEQRSSRRGDGVVAAAQAEQSREREPRLRRQRCSAGCLRVARPPRRPPSPCSRRKASRRVASCCALRVLSLCSAQDPPTQPFTLYGSVYKKFVLERLQGEKVVSREKGVMVTACVSAVDDADSVPGEGAWRRVSSGGQQACSTVRLPGKVEKTNDLKPACLPACRAGCAGALDAYSASQKGRTGYPLLQSDRARVEKACLRSCAVECTKPGKVFDFAIPFRP